MKRSFRSASIGLAMTLALSMFAWLTTGCGTIDANGFLGLETCNILNCDGLFFRNLADDHDDMAGMDGMDDADAHDDGDDDHVDDLDAHDDDGDYDHMDDMDEHSDHDVEDGEHDDAAEGTTKASGACSWIRHSVLEELRRAASNQKNLPCVLLGKY